MDVLELLEGEIARELHLDPFPRIVRGARTGRRRGAAGRWLCECGIPVGNNVLAVKGGDKDGWCGGLGRPSLSPARSACGRERAASKMEELRS